MGRGWIPFQSQFLSEKKQKIPEDAAEGKPFYNENPGD